MKIFQPKKIKNEGLGAPDQLKFDPKRNEWMDPISEDNLSKNHIKALLENPVTFYDGLSLLSTAAVIALMEQINYQFTGKAPISVSLESVSDLPDRKSDINSDGFKAFRNPAIEAIKARHNGVEYTGQRLASEDEDTEFGKSVGHNLNIRIYQSLDPEMPTVFSEEVQIEPLIMDFITNLQFDIVRVDIAENTGARTYFARNAQDGLEMQISFYDHEQLINHEPTFDNLP